MRTLTGRDAACPALRDEKSLMRISASARARSVTMEEVRFCAPGTGGNAWRVERVSRSVAWPPSRRASPSSAPSR